MIKGGRSKARPSQEDLSRLAGVAVKKYLNHDEKDVAELVSEWCSKAKAPQFGEESLPHIVQLIRGLLGSSVWRDEFSDATRFDPQKKRMLEVVEALRVLRVTLPQFIEDYRGVETPTPQNITLSLYELVKAHQPWINALPPVEPGAQPKTERDITSHLSQTAFELWKGEGRQTQADSFAAEAVGWLLDKPQSDGAIARARRRRKRDEAPMKEYAAKAESLRT